MTRDFYIGLYMRSKNFGIREAEGFGDNVIEIVQLVNGGQRPADGFTSFLTVLGPTDLSRSSAASPGGPSTLCATPRSAQLRGHTSCC